MAEVYPSNVPNLIQTGSLSVSPINSVIRIAVDVGKSMTRNNFTGELFFSSWRIQMTKTELNTLMDWYHNTLNKVLTFNFPEPFTGIDREYSFTAQPKSVHIGEEQFVVTYNLKSIIGYSPESPTSVYWTIGDTLEWTIADDLEWT